MKRLALAFALSLPLLSLATPSQAITLTYSDKTQKVAPYFDFRGSYDLPFNLNVNGYVALAPDLSSFVTPELSNSTATSNSDIASQIGAMIKWDTLADVNLNLGYKFALFDVLGFNASITPYLGYRQFWTFTGNANNQSTNTSAQGAHYGGRFNLGLPLGFSAFAYAEASTLFAGSIETGGVSQPIVTNNLTLPGFGLGLNWQLPFVNLASAYVGYKGFFLPTDLRHSDTTFNNGISLVNGISFGFNVLFFGI